jgi:putative pyruvate formate lyase activating enzyme
MSFEPSYLELYHTGELENRINKLVNNLEDCTLCPRKCHVNRNTKYGYCQVGRNAIVSSYFPHFGEEKPLVGIMGSGTIFFSFCNLGCVFCQNFSISQKGEGKAVNKIELAEMMLNLKSKGCHNINLVSPSHVIAQIVEALPIAIEQGLDIPLVYNSGGYDNPETIKLLDDIIDIYMPDIKYGNNDVAYEFSCAKNYWDITKYAVKEMHQQVGDLIIQDGIAKKGLMIRHLVLPEKQAHSENIFKFIASEISNSTYLNIMDQYHPEHKSDLIPNLNKRVNRKEFMETVTLAQKYGLQRLD